MSSKIIRRIIISRTDALGDVVLTLPMASQLKKILGSETEVIFFGKTYSYPIIKCCSAIDGFINYDTFSGLNKEGQVNYLREFNADAIIHVFPRFDISKAAKKSKIGLRIGTTNRIYHWLTCNRLVTLTRKNSSLHEAQLNMMLLKPFDFTRNISIHEIPPLYNLNKTSLLPEKFSDKLSTEKFKLVLHPKSNASAREWKTDHFKELIRLLPQDKIQFIITGGKTEETFIDEWSKELPANVYNLAGRLLLDELISLLNSCDGIVAASTGPLHISAALGKYALGIFPPIRPIDPGRWAPVGYKSGFLVAAKSCSECRSVPENCHCINEISPEMVSQRVIQWLNK